MRPPARTDHKFISRLAARIAAGWFSDPGATMTPGESNYRHHAEIFVGLARAIVTEAKRSEAKVAPTPWRLEIIDAVTGYGCIYDAKGTRLAEVWGDPDRFANPVVEFSRSASSVEEQK